MWWLLCSAGVSILGDRFGELALPVVSLTVTGSTLKTAAVSAAVSLPGLVLALGLSRRLAEGYAKRVAVLADLLQGALFGVLGLVLLAGRASFAALFGFGLALGVASALMAASMPTVSVGTVGRAALLRYNGLQEVTDGVATLTGPLAAGLVLTGLGAAAALLIDASSFAISGLVLGLAVPAVAAATPTASISQYASPGWTAGMRLIRRDGEQRRLQLGNVAMNLHTGGVVLGVVLLARLTLKVSMFETGIILAAAGVGGILSGSLVVPRVAMAHWSKVTAVSFLVCAAGVVALALAPNMPVAAAANVLVDAASVVTFAVVGTRLQQATPPKLLPSVSSLTHQSSLLSQVAGVLVIGLVASISGPRDALLALGFVTLLGAGALGATTSGRCNGNSRSEQ